MNENEGLTIYRDKDEKETVLVDPAYEVVYLCREITESTLLFFHEAFYSELAQEKAGWKFDKVILQFHCPGGDLDTGYALYHFLKDYVYCTGRKIVTYGVSRVSSAAVIPFLASDERCMADYSYILLHWSYVDNVQALFAGRLNRRRLEGLFQEINKELAVADVSLQKFIQQKISGFAGLTEGLKEFPLSIDEENEIKIYKTEAMELGFITSLGNPFQIRKKLQHRKGEV